MTAAPPSAPRAHDWGSAPDLYGPRHQYREALILRRLLPAIPGPRVLNAGSGAGSLSMRLADASLEVTSVEASPELVALTAERLAARHPARALPVIQGDVQALDLPDGAFHGVVCAEVLEHVADDGAAMAELARLLRPGGLACLSVPAGPERWSWVDEWAGHRRRYTAEGLAGLMGAAGLVDVDVRGWGFPLTRLYERAVYRPLLARRLRRAGDGAPSPPGRAIRVAGPALRAAFELDGLFPGRLGLGLIATGRRPTES